MYVKDWGYRYYVSDKPEKRKSMKLFLNLRKVFLGVELLCSMAFVSAVISLFNSATTRYINPSIFEYGVNPSITVLAISFVVGMATLFGLVTEDGESRKSKKLYTECYDVNYIPEGFTYNGKSFEEIIERAEEEGIGEATCEMLLKVIDRQLEQEYREEENKKSNLKNKKRKEEQEKIKKMMDSLSIEESSRIKILESFEQNQDYGEVTKLLMDIVNGKA